jgi:hypothetical protein
MADGSGSGAGSRRQRAQLAAFAQPWKAGGDIWRDAARHQACGAFVKEARVVRLEWMEKPTCGCDCPRVGHARHRAGDNATVWAQHGLIRRAARSRRRVASQRKRFA